MQHSDKLVAFALGRQRYALSLSSVERVIRAVEITPLPKAPDIISGIINMQGRVIPVFNIRKRFGIPDKEISPDDYMIVANTTARTVSFTVEDIEEVMDCTSREIVPPEAILPEMEYVEGVVKLDDGMVFIHDLEKFLCPEEEKELDDALRNTGPDR